MKELCGNCKHFVPQMADPTNRDMGECRRYPASGHLLPGPQPSPIAFWPPHRQDQWCGEWKVNLVTSVPGRVLI